MIKNLLVSIGLLLMQIAVALTWLCIAALSNTSLLGIFTPLLVLVVNLTITVFFQKEAKGTIIQNVLASVWVLLICALGMVLFCQYGMEVLIFMYLAFYFLIIPNIACIIIILIKSAVQKIKAAEEKIQNRSK